MRFVRHGRYGAEQPAVLDPDGRVRDLSWLTADINGAFLADAHRVGAAAAALADHRLDVIAESLSDLDRVGPPIAPPGKVIGIGLNYRDHAAQVGAQVPSEPIIFLKASTTIVGPYDDIVLPDLSEHTDWEVELGLVVGQRLSGRVSAEAALAAVAGYVGANDVTERADASSGPTWAKGKCYDTFCPLGPWLATPDEIPDPHELSLSLSVNGVERQVGTTSQMVFRVTDILVHLASHMTLEPGDLILTGTPSGVAAAHPDPKPFLRAGDVIELAVERLGSQRCTVATGSAT
ncbi:MAG: fumarylacetoacetate hydrolase family protein [Dermatophilaceae bacterium]